ncbi:glycosyltransferase family 2 protein [Conchiformibius kuhniae]|uniref:Glycosyltransferase family 2 protein n=1 Tax=Conchiformibius kuhniae TaxID=211502 RepID=A0A8T9MXN1_9NEIS|nr:glycosyltransferase family 2 protein [Conchiformibius kuhniae]UOP04643.1 glycosyltransferase family 2 protein [Conchiformibius kuhniae]
MSANTTLALIPHYRHLTTLPAVVSAMRACGLPVLVVDDGSGADCHDALSALRGNGTEVLLLPQNGGKGHAFKHGTAWAAQHGFSHVLQIDADAQHCFEDVPKLLAQSAARPAALVCANPVYGSDAPKARRYGRKITNFWNWLHTGSHDIKDGLCGLRIYPLPATQRLIDTAHIGNGMDFDNEILIRLYWHGTPLCWVDTPVRYHQNGVSHFHALRDNIVISKMHARLFFDGMARRLGRRR